MTIPRTPQEAARLIAADLAEMATRAASVGNPQDAQILRALAFKYSTMAETWPAKEVEALYPGTKIVEVMK
jgi:hypothetical protein